MVFIVKQGISPWKTMVFHGILSEKKNITIDITMDTEGTTMVFKNI